MPGVRLHDAITSDRLTIVDLRQEYRYCNLGYLVAGHVVEVLSGVPWEDFVRGRLLDPLGMRRSNLSVGEMLADDDHAAAYTRRDGVITKCRSGRCRRRRPARSTPAPPTWPGGC